MQRDSIINVQLNLCKLRVPVNFQILGGVLLPNNKYGAIVEKVKKGSAADCEGRLLPGKNYSQRMSQVHGKKDNTSSSLNLYLCFCVCVL